MLKIALTGNIGSGKSTVAKIFASLGVPVYFADERSKALLNSDPELRKVLIKNFGEIYNEHGLDRKKFAAILFNDDKAREKANSLIHPAVRNDFIEWMKLQKADYILQEAAILMETGAYKNFDASIVVSAPERIRLERVLHRDGSNASEVKASMQSQWSDEKKAALADHVIINDGEHSLIQQVLDIHQSLISPTR